LLLGPRPDGSLFGKSECRVIEEIAEPVARAIQVALRRQEREQKFEERLQALEKLVASLARRRRPVAQA
jgi:acyl-CoA reductase-like NAD-dependent aldehyde dehydrogenase